MKQTILFLTIVSMTFIFFTTASAGTYVYDSKEPPKAVQSRASQTPSPAPGQKEKENLPAQPEPGSNSDKSSAGKPYQHAEKKGKKGPNK